MYKRQGISRFSGIGIGALAQIYAARELGPEKLGISGMAITMIAQGSILVTFGADALLVREYRELKTQEEKKLYIQDAFSMRFLLAVTLGILLIIFLYIHQVKSEFILAYACVIPMVFLQYNQAFWVFQTEQNLPGQYFANTAGNVMMAALMFLFIRKTSPAGSDLLACIGGSFLSFWLSWKGAINTLPKLRFEFLKMGQLLYRAKWLFISAIVTYGYTQFEQPLLGLLRSVHELGIYRSALQITAGIQPFLAMFSVLLYPKLIACREVSLENLWQYQKKVFLMALVPLSLGFFCVLILLPGIYSIIFGAAYKSAAMPCVLLITSQIIIVLNGIFAWGLWSAKRDKTMMLIMLFTSGISIFLNMLLIPRFGMIATSSINLLSEIIILIASAWFMFRLKTNHA